MKNYEDEQKQHFQLQQQHQQRKHHHQHEDDDSGFASVDIESLPLPPTRVSAENASSTVSIHVRVFRDWDG